MKHGEVVDAPFVLLMIAVIRPESVTCCTLPSASARLPAFWWEPEVFQPQYLAAVHWKPFAAVPAPPDMVLVTVVAGWPFAEAAPTLRSIARIIWG